MTARDLRSLDVGMLRTFDALLRERSVSRAAARLFLSQPAVSASLARLREVFDDTLFTRTGHGVTPTPRALALAPQVQTVLAELQRLLDSDAAFDPAQSNRIFRIAGSDHPSRWVLPGLARRLVELGSAVRIAWEPPGSAPLADRLERGEIDLALVARIQVPRDLDAVVLYDDPYVWATRVGHPLAGGPPSLQTFCQVPQVFLGYGTSTLDDRIDEILARAGHRRQVQMAVGSFGQIVHLLEHSDHAAVLGSRVAAAYAGRLQVQPLPFELPRYHALLCVPRRADRDPGIRWLKDEVLQLHAAGAAG
jgi:DNA-binding transcriptional LysR family regulator